MSFASGLIAGLLIGWIAQWTLDQRFWRRRRLAANQTEQKRSEGLEQQLTHLQEKLRSTREHNEKALQEAEFKLRSLQDELSGTQAELQKAHENKDQAVHRATERANYLEQKLDQAHAELEAVKAERDTAAEQQQRETATLQKRLTAVNRELESLKKATPPELIPPAQPTQLDRLEAIRGIGEVFAQRFHEAGIHTYADLAGLDPETARTIVGVRGRSAVNVENWIAEAEKLAVKQSVEDNSN